MSASKTITQDNEKLRALFVLPAIKQSEGVELSALQLPPQQVVTGDSEIDAVLWLREVITSGQDALIEKAMLAAKQIKTPLKVLEKRYLDYLVAKNPGNWTVAFKTFGFADLEGLAQGSAKKLARQHEARSRFGDDLHNDTPPEQFCIKALAGLKPSVGFLDEDEVDQRFKAHPDLMPGTLSDCLYELAFWRALYTLRHACDGGDQGQEAYARECFAFRRLMDVKPRTAVEAIEVFRYLTENERMDDSETEGILLNLISGPLQSL
jgi:hypothetical protein